MRRGVRRVRHVARALVGSSSAFDRGLERDGEVLDMRGTEVHAQARKKEGGTGVICTPWVGDAASPFDVKQEQRVLALCRAGTSRVRPGPHPERAVPVPAHLCEPQAAVVDAQCRVARNEGLHGCEHASPSAPA